MPQQESNTQLALSHCAITMSGSSSDGWSAVGDPQADGACCSSAALSCEGQKSAQSLRVRPDLEDGGRTSYNEIEAAELAARQQPSCCTFPRNCRGMTPVAFMCLILVRFCDSLLFL